MANALKTDLRGKVVDIRGRRFFVQGGFGAVPFTSGNALFVLDLITGESTRMEGWMVDAISDDQTTGVPENAEIF